jgi:hypothetical protein
LAICDALDPLSPDERLALIDDLREHLDRIEHCVRPVSAVTFIDPDTGQERTVVSTTIVMPWK